MDFWASPRTVRKASACLFAAVLALVGCGGSKPFSIPATETCLDSTTQVRATSTDAADLDFIAQRAGEGAIATTLADGDYVVLVFERSPGDARATADAYRAVAGGKGDVEQRGNVVVAWDASPRESDAKLVRGCLSS